MDHQKTRSVKRWPVDRPILATKCQPVPEGEDVSALIDEMKRAMDYPRGIGLAANQLGEDKRIIVIRLEHTNLELINPEIYYWHKSKPVVAKEGCLSFPGRGVLVPRNRHVKVIGYDRYWREVRTGGKNLLARVIQHEIDHLDGITMVDRNEEYMRG